MKRIFVLGFLFLFAVGIAYAVPPVMVTNPDGSEIMHIGSFGTYTVAGSIGSNGYTYISTSTIGPGTKILGYQTYYKTGFNMTTVLWDASNATQFLVGGLLINEAEQNTINYKPVWFPYPRKLTYGLLVWNQGCDVNIFYVQ